MTFTTALTAEGAQQIQAASGAFTLTWLLVALPLLSAGILLVGGRRTDSFGHVLGTLVPWACFVIAAVMFLAMLNTPSDGRAFDQHLFTWIQAGSFSVDAGLQIDPLSMSFVLLVTFVGSLIHTYSVAYMEHDADRRACRREYAGDTRNASGKHFFLRLVREGAGGPAHRAVDGRDPRG